MFFLSCALQVGLAGWTFTGPPIVGKWAAGLFTMIDQFRDGSGECYSNCSTANAAQRH
jgi:hypothetical protein